MLMHLTTGTNMCNARADFLNRDLLHELPCPDMQIYQHCCISRISDYYVNATDRGKKKGRGGRGGRNVTKHNELKFSEFCYIC